MTQGSHESDKPSIALQATASKLQTQQVPKPREAAESVICSVAIATLFNVVMHKFVPDQVINMFFISPYFKKTMPILNEAWHNLHWFGTILLYVVGVSVFAFLIFLLQRQIVFKEEPKSAEDLEKQY